MLLDVASGLGSFILSSPVFILGRIVHVSSVVLVQPAACLWIAWGATAKALAFRGLVEYGIRPDAKSGA